MELIRSPRVLCSAGNSPKKSPVPTLSSAEKMITAGLMPKCHRGGGFWREKRLHDIERPLRHEQEVSTASQRQHDTFGEQLRHQMATCRTQRESHAHLRRAAGATRQQQIGDVGTGDQQHNQVTEKSSMIGVCASVLMPLCPRAPGASVICFFLKLSIVLSLIPSCSGASTSLMMGE